MLIRIFFCSALLATPLPAIALPSQTKRLWAGNEKGPAASRALITREG